MIFQALAYKLLPSPGIILKYMDLLLEQVVDFCHDTLFRKNLLNLIPLAGSITKQDHKVNVIDNFQQHLATFKNTLLFNSSTPTITPVHFLNWKTKISISVDLMTINLWMSGGCFEIWNKIPHLHTSLSTSFVQSPITQRYCSHLHNWILGGKSYAGSRDLAWKVASLAPVVRRMDKAIHRLNRYPVDKC